MDSVKLSLDIQNSLLDTLKETKISMERFNTLLQKQEKTVSTIDDHYDDIEETHEKIVKHSRTWNTLLDKTRQFALAAAGPLTAIFSTGAIIDTVGAMLKHNRQMRDLSFRMAEAGKNVDLLTKSMHNVAMATGVSTEQATSMIIQLRHFRVATKDVERLAEATIKFSDITGIAADNAGRLAGELVRVGRLGVDNVKAVMTTMANTQRAVGLTENEMEQLNESIIGATQYLGQLNKSAGQITAFSKGVVQLAGAFTKAGLSVEKVSKFVEDLLDPGRIEDNALMYAKLGVSIGDVISGNVDIQNMGPAFKRLGQEFKEMSGPAASALAQSMGMTLREARALADITMETAEGQKGLNKMWEEQLSPQQRLEQAMNRLGTTLEGLATNLLGPINTLAKIMNSIFDPKKGLMILGMVALGAAVIFFISRFRRRMLTMNTEVAQHQERVTTEALVMAHRKAAAVTAQGGGRGGMRAMDLSTRVRGGTDFRRMQAEAEQYGIIAESNLVGPVRRMVQHTDQWLRKISEGAKPISLLVSLAEKHGARVQHRLNLTREEEVITLNRLKIRKEDLQQQRNVMQQRIAALETMKRTAEQEWELGRLGKDSQKVTRQITDLQMEQVREKDRFIGLTNSYLRKLAPEERFAIIKNLEVEQQRQETVTRTTKARMDQVDQENKMLGLQREVLQREEKSLGTKLQGKRATAEEAEQYTKIRNQLKNVNETLVENTREWEQQKVLRGTATDQLTKIRGQLAQVRGAGGERAPALRLSFWRRSANLLKSAGRDLGSRIVRGADAVRNSAKQFIRALGERLNPKNWLRAFRARNRQNQTMGRSFGKLFRVIGMITTVLFASKQFREMMGRVMKSIQPIMKTLLETLGPIFESLLQTFLPLFKTLIKTLMPPALKLLGGLLFVMGHLIRVMGSLMGKIVEFGIDLGIQIRGLFAGGEQRKEAKGIFKGLSPMDQRMLKMQGITAEGIGENQAMAHDFLRAYRRQESNMLKISRGMEQFGESLIKTGGEMWGTDWAARMRQSETAPGTTASPGAKATKPATILTAIGKGFKVTGVAEKKPVEEISEGIQGTEENTATIMEINTSIHQELIKLNARLYQPKSFIEIERIRKGGDNLPADIRKQQIDIERMIH